MALPVTNRTAWFNPETNAKLWQVYQSGAPYHNTAAADNAVVQAQEDEDATNLSAINTTSPPTWQSTTPLMAYPCIAFDGTNDILRWFNDAGTVAVAASQVFTTTAKTASIAFYATGATLNSASPWLNHTIWSEAGGYTGLYLKTSGGNYYVYYYNFAGAAQVTADYQITLNTSYVATIWHDGTNIKIYINGVLWSTVASGATGSLGSQMCNGGGIGGFFQGREGEQVFYNAALGATPLADLNTYVTGRWLVSAATFNAAWNIAANTVIHGGAIAA